MKYFRSTFLFAALAALFSQQALAADEVTPAKKRPPAKEAKRPVTNNPKSASEQLLDQSGQQVRKRVTRQCLHTRPWPQPTAITRMASQYPPSHDRSGKHRQPDSGQHQEVAYTTPGRMRRDLFNQNTDFVRRSIRAQPPRIEQVHAHAQFFLHLIHARAQGCEQTAVNQHRRLSIRLFSLDYGGQRGRCLQKAIAGQ